MAHVPTGRWTALGYEKQQSPACSIYRTLPRRVLPTRPSGSRRWSLCTPSFAQHTRPILGLALAGRCRPRRSGGPPLLLRATHSIIRAGSPSPGSRQQKALSCPRPRGRPWKPSTHQAIQDRSSHRLAHARPIAPVREGVMGRDRRSRSPSERIPEACEKRRGIRAEPRSMFPNLRPLKWWQVGSSGTLHRRAPESPFGTK